MAKATAKKVVSQPVKAANAKPANGKPVKATNGNSKTQVVTPKVEAKAAPEVCKTCGRPFVSVERSSAAKRAWDTIRANREAGFKTTAERLSAAKEVKVVKTNGSKANGKVAPKAQSKAKQAKKV